MTQRGLTWELAQWSVPGGRYVTQAFVIGDDRLYASVRLTSAEGDHAALWSNVVEPMLETLRIGAG